MISVIVPVYNSKDYIGKCVDSIISQSYKDIEVILVDDGSTDGSEALCDKYAQDDKRVKAVHSANKGPSSARNIGLSNSKGDLIMFLDSDDYLEPNALCTLVGKYQEHGTDIVIGNFRTFSNNAYGAGHKGTFESDTLMMPNDVMNYALSYLNAPNRATLFAYSWGRLFKASVIRENRLTFDPELFTFEDVAFNYEYLKHASKVYFLKNTVCTHVVHGNYMSATMSMSGNPRKLFGYMKALNSIGSYLSACNPDADYSGNVGHAFTSLSIIQFVRLCGQYNEDNKYKILNLISEIIFEPEFRNNLKYYSPIGKDSKLLPLLMKFRLTRIIILVCRYKAHKRYGTVRN